MTLISKCIVNLCGEDPMNHEIFHNFMGECIEIEYFLNPTSLKNLNKSKGLFALFNDKIYFFVISHFIGVHGSLFLKIGEFINIKESKFCKIENIDSKNKIIKVNSFYNYPNYNTFLDKIEKFIKKKYPSWKLEYIEDYKYFKTDNQCYNDYFSKNV